MKKFFKVFFIVCALLSLTLSVEAHSGKTDGAGGHYNRSTGEYHYHHGYSAHQHYDIDGDGKKDCPYDFNDKTNHNITNNNSNNSSNNNISNNTSNNKTKSNELTFSEILLIILKIIGTTLLVLLVGYLGWICVYAILDSLLSWFCKKILKVDANESVISKITIVIILVIGVIIASLIVLNSEGLL